jgi:hypothetical protein
MPPPVLRESKKEFLRLKMGFCGKRVYIYMLRFAPRVILTPGKGATGGLTPVTLPTTAP